MTNGEKLKQLLIDVFLLEPNEYRIALKKEDVDTWDSLGTVAMAVGIQEAFGYHLTAREAVDIRSVRQIISTLESKGIMFDE